MADASEPSPTHDGRVIQVNAREGSIDSAPPTEKREVFSVATDRSNAMDHMIVVLFENHSLDSLLGHLYGPEDGKTFEGVIGKNLSNPIPEWAEDGAERKTVPYTVATDMDSPNPDSGEEYPHTNTQLLQHLE